MGHSRLRRCKLSSFVDHPPASGTSTPSETHRIISLAGGVSLCPRERIMCSKGPDEEILYHSGRSARTCLASDGIGRYEFMFAMVRFLRHRCRKFPDMGPPPLHSRFSPFIRNAPSLDLPAPVSYKIHRGDRAALAAGDRPFTVRVCRPQRSSSPEPEFSASSYCPYGGSDRALSRRAEKRCLFESSHADHAQTTVPTPFCAGFTSYERLSLLFCILATI
jgi:hypothetical protein